MKSRVFLAGLGVATAAVLVGQLSAVPGGGERGNLRGGSGAGEPDGNDIYDLDPCIIGDLRQFGSIGSYPNGTVGMGISTTGHNNGNVGLPWYVSPQPHHPVIAQNMYRVNDQGRLEQIGMSWLKHAWFAVQGSSCGSCQAIGNPILGVGCADTYGSGLNAEQAWLGPRWEITPQENIWMDGVSWVGSHFQRNSGNNDTGPHNSVQHRLRVRMGDLDVPNSTYYYEAMYVLLRKIGDPTWDAAREQVTHLFNNATHDKVNVSRNGNNFTFTEFNTNTDGPVIMTWGDTQAMLVPDQPATPPEVDPVSFLASRAVDLGNGQYRYEYNILNYTDSQGLCEFQVPVGNADVSDVGFHQPLDGYWDAGGNFVSEAVQNWGGASFSYDQSPWTGTVEDGVLKFAPPVTEGNVRQNDIRWGTMYTFWFTSDAVPNSDGTATICRSGGGGGTYTAPGVMTPSTGELALTDVFTGFGTEVSGNVASLEAVDGDKYIARSAFGFSAQQANLLRVVIRYQSPAAQVSIFNFELTGELDNPGGSVDVGLFNYDTSQYESVHSFAMGSATITEPFSVEGGMAPYIRNADNRVQVRLTTSVVATFSAAGFHARYDQFTGEIPN